MDLELRGKTALITGGSKGIGFAIADKLVSEGCAVRLVARDPAGLAEASAALEKKHGKAAVTHAANLGDTAQLESVYPLLDGVDVLVNSAGAVPRGTLLEVTAADLRVSFEVKVLGTMNLCREALLRMRARGGGVIVNIIGTSGENPSPKAIPTTSVNGALVAFTQAAGAISVDDNVRIVGVSPGMVATGRQAHRKPSPTLPWGRMADPAEVADLAVFLASARASYLSGAIYTIDAGQRMRP